MITNKYKKGDKFTTPSGIIKIIAISKETSTQGSGYRIANKVIVPFDEFNKNVQSKLWEQI